MFSDSFERGKPIRTIGGKNDFWNFFVEKGESDKRFVGVKR